MQVSACRGRGAVRWRPPGSTATSRMLKFVGVGNIAAHLRSRGRRAEGRGLVSHNGIVGGTVRKIQEFEYQCPEDGLLVMHSDGLQSRWDLERYAGLDRAASGGDRRRLYRDFTAAATTSPWPSSGFPWRDRKHDGRQMHGQSRHCSSACERGARDALTAAARRARAGDRSNSTSNWPKRTKGSSPSMPSWTTRPRRCVKRRSSRAGFSPT